VINKLAERLTGAFQVATGENLPTSTSATEASMQASAVKSGFGMIKDAIGGFLERWMDRHALPIIAAKELTKGQLVRIAGDEENYNDLIEQSVLYMADKALDESFNKGYLPSPQEIAQEIQSATEKVKKNGLYLTLVKDIIASELETQMVVTNEEMDISVTVQNLLQMAQIAPQYADQIVQQAVDLMGLAPFKSVQQPMQGQPQGQPQPSPLPQGQQQQQLTTSALTR